VNKPDRWPSLAAVPTTFISRAFTGLAADAESLLSMRYAAKGKIAWRRDAGQGRVYAYFGPLDLRQREDSWVLAYNLPFRFINDGSTTRSATENSRPRRSASTPTSGMSISSKHKKACWR